jgi:hypothetical protein
MLTLVGTLLRTFIVQTGKTRYTYAERGMKFYWLNSAISSVFYYVIRTPDRIISEGREFIEVFYGQPDSMTFVTNSPLRLKGVVLARLYFQDGSVYLNETPIFSPLNDYANPGETAETQRTLILEKVREIRFTYLKRPRSVRGTAQQMAEQFDAGGAFGAGGLNSGGKKTQADDEAETDRLDGEVPAGVKLTVTFDDNRIMGYCFRVQSDFVHKKDMTYGNYHGL